MRASRHDPTAPAHACCTAIREGLRRRLPAQEEVFFGPDFADSAEPAPTRLRAGGAHFFWVAVPIGGVPFWDAHVGIVVDPTRLTGTVGVHRSRGSAEAGRRFARLAPLFDEHRLRHETSEAAGEEQWNGPPGALSGAAPIERACEVLVGLLAAVRRRLAPPGGERDPSA